MRFFRTSSRVALLALLFATGPVGLAQNATTPPTQGEPPERTPRPPERKQKEEPERQPANSQQIILKPRFTKGRLTRYELSMVSDNNLRTDDSGRPQKQEMTQTIDLAVTVKEVDQDGATVEIVYERMRASLNSDEYKASFDSNPGSKPIKPTRTAAPAKPRKGAKPEPKAPESPDMEPIMDDLLEQVMRPMVGSKLTMKVDADGNIKSVSGGDALGGAGLGAIGLLMGGVGLGGTPSVGSAGGNPMAWIVNSPGQKGLARIGESWTNTDELGGTPIGGFKMVTRHTCNSVSETKGGRVANLSFNGRADQDSAGGGIAGGFKLTESAYNGKYVWDLKAGELKSMSSTLKTKIDGRLNGRTVGMDAQTRMTVTRLD